MSEKQFLVEFRNAESRYIAYGPESVKNAEVFHQVYCVGRHGHFKPTPGVLFFPSCIRFMPYSEIDEEVEMTMEEIVAKYGHLLPDRVSMPLRKKFRDRINGQAG